MAAIGPALAIQYVPASSTQKLRNSRGPQVTTTSRLRSTQTRVVLSRSLSSADLSIDAASGASMKDPVSCDWKLILSNLLSISYSTGPDSLCNLSLKFAHFRIEQKEGIHDREEGDVEQ